MKRARRLARRYGRAASEPLWDVRYAPWVEQLKGRTRRGSCLYQLVKAALDARKTAKDEQGDAVLIESADKAITAIREHKTRSTATACKVASAALRKYVQAWGGSDAEADVLTP